MSTIARRLAALERRFARRKPEDCPLCVVSTEGMTPEEGAAEIAKAEAALNAWARRMRAEPPLLIVLDA